MELRRGAGCDPDSGEIVGIVDLTGDSSTAHPSNFACAVATAEAVEAFLRSTMLESDARLRARYDDLVHARGRQALVSRTGRVLSGRPEGWLPAQRLSPPPGGGVVTLPSGVILLPRRSGTARSTSCVRRRPVARGLGR